MPLPPFNDEDLQLGMWMQPWKPHQKSKETNKQPQTWLLSRVLTYSGLQTCLEEWAVWSNVLNFSHKEDCINYSENCSCVLSPPLRYRQEVILATCGRHGDAQPRLPLKAGLVSGCGGVGTGSLQLSALPGLPHCREQPHLSSCSSQGSLLLVTFWKKE